MFASPIIQVYLIIAGSVLVLAGLAIAVLKWGLKKNVDHAWRAYRGWLFMIPPVIAAVLLGRIATIVFFGLIAIAGFTEFARATGLYRDWLITGLIYLGIAGVTLVTLIAPPDEPSTLGWYGMFMALPVYVVAGILLMPILRDRTKGQLQLVALGMVGFIY